MKDNERYMQDVKWGLNNYFNLMKKYPDKWVAIVNKKVVSYGENLKKVELEARKGAGKKKGYTSSFCGKWCAYLLRLNCLLNKDMTRFWKKKLKII